MYTNYNTHTVMCIKHILFHNNVNKYAFGIKSARDEVIKWRQNVTWKVLEMSLV